jgi:ubiquinone/menaquinone biosynthesis C-methylase UbiE
MEIHDAIELLRDAVGDSRGVWADLGAGTGTFTRALAASLGMGSTIYAVDDDAGAVRALRALPPTQTTRLVAVKADFTQPLELATIGDTLLDGILLANSLHFVRNARDVLRTLVERLRVAGRVVVVEYDRRGASRWVPYPIPASRWPELAAAAGLTAATITATRPSAYQGIIYAGTATKA